MKKKKGKSTFKKTVAWLHLWPSLISGIIIVFVCITGTMIVYTDEVLNLSAGDALYVQPQENKISHDKVFQKLHRLNPNYKLSEIVFYKEPNRSIRLRVFDLKTHDLMMIYMDPYTGNILKEDHTIYFFYITAHLHAQLLAGKIGGWIVVISTIVFFIGSVTGLILWWPKKWTKTTKQASFNIKWKATFKRLNYDLHNVLGFYSLPICIILSLTGLLIFFHPLMDFTVKISGGAPSGIQNNLPKVDSTRASKDMIQMAYKTFEKHDDKKALNIWVYKFDEVGAYAFNTGNPGLKSVENLETTVYDRYTGQEIPFTKGEITHEKVENYIWQLHMGQWWGQIGKIITFVVGVIATSLSITGFIIWWGRRKKKKK